MIIPNHQKGGRYLKDAVYGANDGIITTFAVIAGVMGADLPAVTAVLLGTANLLADGFSMAVSNWLSLTSDADVYRRERAVEEWEFHNRRAEELKEMNQILLRRGYNAEDAQQLTGLFAKNKNFWLDTMIHEELHLTGDTARPMRAAFTTFFAFVVAGAIPLLGYLFFPTDHRALFPVASLLTALSLFSVGSLRSRFTKKRWFFAGFEMMAVGGIAAAIAYGIGALAQTLI